MKTNERTLGEVIMSKRQELGITQRELSRRLDCSNATISRIEKDDGIQPDTGTLKALASALNLDYNFLLALSDHIDDDSDIRMIQRAAKKMDESQHEEMMRILKDEFAEAFNDDEGDGL